MTKFRSQHLGVIRTIMAAGCLTMLLGCAHFGADQTSIEGHWKLTALNGKPLPLVKKPQKVAYTLNLNSNGTAHGILACNNWRANYEHKNQQLLLDKAITTRKLCLIKQPMLKELERTFLNNLNHATIAEVNEQALVLEAADQSRWRFKKIKQP